MNANLRIPSCLTLPLLFLSSVIGQKINVTYTPVSSQENFSGNVFLYLSKDNKNPKDGNVGIELFPCYSKSVKNIKPNQKVLFDDAALAYPVPLSEIERGEYIVQAVWDKNSGGRSISNSPGNMYSDPVKLRLTKNNSQVFYLVCNLVIKEQPFIETKYIKEAKVASALLTEFYKRPASVNAAVLLPKEYYEDTERRFPVLYRVSGYGGDYHYYSGKELKSQPIDTTPCIQVFLDGNCPLGHSVYANSENNGPWGTALTRELIPAIEKNYRCNAARLLTGHSSGGWSVLWLQTHYPGLFTACWSSSPDPVDFRNFQQVDLYTDKNIFYGKDSSLRMVATVAGYFPWVYMKNMYAMENVISRGEQMHSFEAVFSAKNRDGTPRRLCNARTGEIDKVTVDHWKNYDISLYLRTNWDQLKPDLDGKLRISVGNQDNFLLNHAVHLLEDEMKKLNARFIFAYYPGDHFTVTTPEYKSSGNQFLQQKYNDLINTQQK
ncbi:MAG: alpha/beta hydrolase-fold protein [Ferruginibacter sp.]